MTSTPTDTIAAALRQHRRLPALTGEDRPALLARLAVDALIDGGWRIIHAPHHDEENR